MSRLNLSNSISRLSKLNIETVVSGIIIIIIFFIIKKKKHSKKVF
jgi:hypothetical protein